MSWFLFALVCTLGWGLADMFYKKGSDETDRYSHLRIAVWVGFVMGLGAFGIMIFRGGMGSLRELLGNALRYAPASLSYIVSMVIGYAGLRYLELSVVSPVQNASGALSMVAMLLFFMITGRVQNIGEAFSVLDLVGTGLIVVGVIALAVVEKKLEKEPEVLPSETPDPEPEASSEAASGRKYRVGALALLFPLLYCVFDTIGTAADGIILDSEAGLGLGETEVLVLYGLTFFLAGIAAFIFLWIREKKPYNLFAPKEHPKMAAAVAEEFGQIFYVFAMARNPMLAAPMVASYCIVSVLLSRIFLKEKLRTGQLLSVITVIAGIVLLGISEGLAG